jgi:hypothetical protein
MYKIIYTNRNFCDEHLCITKIYRLFTIVFKSSITTVNSKASYKNINFIIYAHIVHIQYIK